MLLIKKAGIEQIDIIRALAQETWPVSYKGVITDEQIVYMLEMIYSKAALLDQMENLRHQFLIIYEQETPVGFASYVAKPNDSTGIFRLNKLYVLPTQQGKGTGKILLDYIIEEIKPSGATAIELNVNKKNTAFHFYTKHNFTVERSETIDIGNGYLMDDYIMVKTL